MKRFRILALLLAFTCATPALLHAQIVKGEVFVGGNTTQVDGDECYAFRRFGVHAGAGALVPITSWMDVGLEVLFGQKGAYKGDSINQHLGLYTGTYDLRLNYAEVPVMVYLTDKDRFSVGLGVSYGRLVGLKEATNGIPTAIAIGDGNLHWREDNPNFPTSPTSAKSKTSMNLAIIFHKPATPKPRTSRHRSLLSSKTRLVTVPTISASAPT